MSKKSKAILIIVLKCVIFAVGSAAISTMIHAFSSAYIEGIHGKPSFVSNSLLTFTIVTNILFAIGYLVLGVQLPISNPLLRGFTYIMLIWISNYVPQVMGLAGADGEIAKKAFRAAIVICDSIAYVFSGILLGALFQKVPNAPKKECKMSTFRKSILMSAICFPLLVIVMDQLIRRIYKPFSGAGAIGVSDSNLTLFYFIFYSCFIVSGIFIAIFYRMTEYNRDSSYGWLHFGIKYSLLLWTPIVLIMVVFGTAVLPTVMYSLIFIVCILLISWGNGKMLEHAIV